MPPIIVQRYLIAIADVEQLEKGEKVVDAQGKCKRGEVGARERERLISEQLLANASETYSGYLFVFHFS